MLRWLIINLLRTNIFHSLLELMSTHRMKPNVDLVLTELPCSSSRKVNHEANEPADNDIPKDPRRNLAL